MVIIKMSKNINLNIIICGGGLQGVELCFLAKQASWNIILIDKQENCLAKNLAHTFVNYDLLSLNNEDNKIKEIFKSADIVIPANENKKCLEILTEYCKKNALPLAFDKDAYKISSSKLKSRDFFIDCKSPIPEPFLQKKDISYPLLAKPSEGSGSKGVQVFYDEKKFIENFPEGINTDNWIFESYHEGISYSIEVCGKENNYKAYTITKLHMDEIYDCCAVTTPSGLSRMQEQKIEQEVIKLAKKLNLRGIMDLELIITKDNFVILEIDARFPSQTPLTIFYASGVNLLEELVSAFIDYTPQSQQYPLKKVRYEHFIYEDNILKSIGEHIFKDKNPLIEKTFKGKPMLYTTKDNTKSIASTFILTGDNTNNNIKNEQINFLKNI